ncbi:MAG: 1-phosphofructokinase family hexose kinase [Rhizomicrobium sp.]
MRQPSPILTLTMNPAVDVSSMVATMEPYQKLRCTDVWHHPGGGGINVSRVIKRLGSETIAVFPAGGPMGALFKRLLTDEGVRHLSIPIEGDTREDFSVSVSATGEQFRFILPGPHLSASEMAACLNTVAARLRPSSFLVASGSLPPGVMTDFYGRVARIATNASAKFVLDSSGAALREAVERGGLFLSKPSQSELAELAGTPVNGRDACIEAARDLVSSRRIEFVCVSLGAEGALLVGQGCTLFARAPQVEVKTTIGAGDSLLAALVWAFAHHSTPAEALKFAVAAGTAALLSPGTGLCSLADIQRLKMQTHVDLLERAA